MFIRREFLVWLSKYGDSRSIAIQPTSVAITTRVNDVPTAIVSVAIGRDFSPINNDTTAELQAIEQWSIDRELIVIRCRVTEFDLNNSVSQVFEQDVFLGYIVAPSTQLTRQGSSYTFQMHHWTVDLMGGSMLAHFAIASLENKFKEAQFRNPSKTGLNVTSSLNVFFGFPTTWQTDLPNDIWAAGFKSVIANFASHEFESTLTQQYKRCELEFNKPPEALKAAVKRLQGVVNGLSGFDLPYDVSGAPIRIREDITPSYRSILARNLASKIGGQPLTDFARSTFWDALLQYCADFDLLFVPRATDALVVPIRIGAKMPDVIDISETQNAEVSWTAFQQMATRGVATAAISESRTGAKMNAQGLYEFGCYVGTSDRNRGQINFLALPPWLTGVGSELADAKTAEVKSQAGLSTATKRGTIQPATIAANEIKAFAKDSYAQMLEGWAQSRYYSMSLANRVLSVACPLRFDIGVGSMVTIGLRADRLTARINTPVQSVAGLVIGTTLTIDRARSIASMLYQLDYVRTKTQLADPQYYYDKHPLYEDTPRIIAY